MANNRLESFRPDGDAAKGESNGAAESGGKMTTAGAGGFKAWLPLIVTMVSMPLLAYATTTLVLLPKLRQTTGANSDSAVAETGKASNAPNASHGGKEAGPAGKARLTVPLSKVLVNVAGTMGTRYLMTSVTLVGSVPDFKSRIEENKDQLLDLAASALSTKTISDLEKPGARNLVRTELITVFNSALGAELVQEIFITEFAIQ
ncbi:MAG: flagellar basal body-associated FliL family protein [Chloroflexi bacterium]|nr:flagellar basal body-associated FliL family protein [Chloroflexota bacterium]